jgi:hypothetical protein
MSVRPRTVEWSGYQVLTPSSTILSSPERPLTQVEVEEQTSGKGPVARVLIDFDHDGNGWWMIHPLSDWLLKARSEDARAIATDFFRFLGDEIEAQLGFELLADLVNWNAVGERLYSVETEFPNERESFPRGVTPIEVRRQQFDTFWKEGDGLAHRVRQRLAKEYQVWIITDDVAYRRID